VGAVETTALTGLEPRSFWAHFEALTRIPRPSRQEEPVIEHVRAWAAEHGFELHQDAGRNLVLRVPATSGRESAPTVSLLLTVWVGGIMTQALIEDLHPYLPRPVDLRRKSLKEKFLGTFRCQTYWLLATRGAWRVLWALARTGRFEPAKTDRVTGRRVPTLSPAGRGQGEGS